MEATLQVQDLCIRRGKTHILSGVNWDIRPGEQWVILGANDSGKTSLLNTLSGFLQPTEGEIQVFGQTFGETDWSQLRRVIGVVNHTVADWINGSETALEIAISGIHSQINYWGRITREDRAKALTTLEEYGLAYAAERCWNQLSQGERQRALICRALLAQYRLLILDEPCGGLDPVARTGFLRFMEKLTRTQENAPALILVTHHVEEITPGFTHVLVLKNGRVHAAGPKREVLTTRILSDAFHAEVTVRRSGEDFRLEL